MCSYFEFYQQQESAPTARLPSMCPVESIVEERLPGEEFTHVFKFMNNGTLTMPCRNVFGFCVYLFTTLQSDLLISLEVFDFAVGDTEFPGNL